MSSFKTIGKPSLGALNPNNYFQLWKISFHGETPDGAGVPVNGTPLIDEWNNAKGVFNFTTNIPAGALELLLLSHSYKVQADVNYQDVVFRVKTQNFSYGSWSCGRDLARTHIINSDGCETVQEFGGGGFYIGTNPPTDPQVNCGWEERNDGTGIIVTCSEVAKFDFLLAIKEQVSYSIKDPLPAGITITEIKKLSDL